MIALGDVAVSFSSIVDENSNELYKGLSDDNLVVKKNTLMVLTHLILNGMIKVKGQLGEMAKCLEDEEPRISDLAKLFFTELSTKDNAIYNNLPDSPSTLFTSIHQVLTPSAVISHLSTGDHAVNEDTFQSTMRYIFTFIEKVGHRQCKCASFSYFCRKNKPRTLWRNFASDFVSPTTPDNGETSLSACPCSHSSQRDLPRSSSRDYNSTETSSTSPRCSSALQIS